MHSDPLAPGKYLEQSPDMMTMDQLTQYNRVLAADSGFMPRYPLRVSSPVNPETTSLVHRRSPVAVYQSPVSTRLHNEDIQSGTLRFNTVGPPEEGQGHRRLFPINDIRGVNQVADVMNLPDRGPCKPISVYTSDWHPDLNQSAFEKRSLELRMRDRMTKEHGGCAWYTDFLVGNRIGIHNKREYAHDYRHVPKDITW